MILRSGRGGALLDAVYGAAAEPADWPQVLTRVSDHLGATGGQLIYNAPPGRIGFQVTGRLDDGLSDLYLRRHAWNPWTLAMRGVPFGRATVANSLLEPGAIRRTALHAEILAPQGIADMLCVSHRAMARDGGVGGFGFALTERAAEQVAGPARRFARLVPHLARALDASLALGRHADGTRQLAAVLQRMPGPALLLDGWGRIRHANPAAEAMLRSGDGMAADRDGGLHLTAALPAETRALARAVAEALAVAAGGEEMLRPPLRLTRPSGRPPLLVVLVPLPPPAFALWSLTEAARALVLVTDPAQPLLAVAEAAGVAFGLTAAEARVAALIGGGLSGPQAAAALGVSLTTVKTHLARCFQKTGIRTQAGLARLLAGLPAGSARF